MALNCILQIVQTVRVSVLRIQFHDFGLVGLKCLPNVVYFDLRMACVLQLVASHWEEP